MSDFAKPASDLGTNIPNTVKPAPGKGLTLDETGRVDLGLLQQAGATNGQALAWNDTDKKWEPATTTGISVTETNISLSDVTTDNVTSTKHGFAPKSPADATKFLNGAATPAYAQPKDSDLSTSDITTNDVSTTKHGFVPKAPNDTTKFLRGDATWAAATGSGGKLYDFTISGADQASIDSNVDGTTVANFSGYDLLEIFILARTDEAGAQVNIDVTLNNDSSAIYDFQQHYGSATTVAAGTSLAQTKWSFTAHGSGGSASYPAAMKMEIPGYAGTTFWKVATHLDALPDATAGNNIVVNRAIGYRSTSAITRVKIAAQGAAKLKIGSRLIVYGR